MYFWLIRWDGEVFVSSGGTGGNVWYVDGESMWGFAYLFVRGGR